MKVAAPVSDWKRRERNACPEITCYMCDKKGHKARACPNERQERKTQLLLYIDIIYCRYSRSSTHKDASCRRKKEDNMKQAEDDICEEQLYAFKVSECQLVGLKHRGTGATLHIITDAQKFDESFQPQNHTVELADGMRTNGVALRRSDAEVTPVDCEGKGIKATLKPRSTFLTYPQDIFSIKVVMTNGASVNFRGGHSELIHKSGTRFDIKGYNRLYYLNTVNYVTVVLIFRHGTESLGTVIMKMFVNYRML